MQKVYVVRTKDGLEYNTCSGNPLAAWAKWEESVKNWSEEARVSMNAKVILFVEHEFNV